VCAVGKAGPSGAKFEAVPARIDVWCVWLQVVLAGVHGARVDVSITACMCLVRSVFPGAAGIVPARSVGAYTPLPSDESAVVVGVGMC
jgi:hypothetical protein